MQLAPRPQASAATTALIMAREASMMPTVTPSMVSVKGGHVEAFILGEHGNLVVVGTEDEKAVAGLDLLLVGDGVEFFLECLVGDVDDGELLAVVAGGGVADGLEDEVHGLGGYGFALVAAHGDAVEQSLAYVFHVMNS